MGEIDGAGGAEFFAGFAGAFEEVSAVLAVDNRVLGHGLREGGVNGFAVSQTSFVNLVDHLLGTFFLADAAAGAQIGVDRAGFLFDRYREIAHVTIDMGHFSPGEQGNVGMNARRDHLGGENAGGAVEGGEGLVELSHVTANGGLTLNQENMVTCVGDLESSLDDRQSRRRQREYRDGWERAGAPAVRAR